MLIKSIKYCVKDISEYQVTYDVLYALVCYLHRSKNKYIQGKLVLSLGLMEYFLNSVKDQDENLVSLFARLISELSLKCEELLIQLEYYDDLICFLKSAIQENIESSLESALLALNNLSFCSEIECKRIYSIDLLEIAISILLKDIDDNIREAAFHLIFTFICNGTEEIRHQIIIENEFLKIAYDSLDTGKREFIRLGLLTIDKILSIGLAVQEKERDNPFVLYMNTRFDMSVLEELQGNFDVEIADSASLIIKTYFEIK